MAMLAYVDPDAYVDPRWSADWTLPQVSARKFNALSEAARRALMERIRLFADYRSRNAIFRMFPDAGLLRRELYAKHLEFFEAGSRYRERCFMAANRVGKTEGAGGFETALHLTGLYPIWWRGRRFARPVRWWAAGKTNESTRDIVQRKLFGRVVSGGNNKTVAGTGLVPANCVVGRPSWKQGVSDLVDTISVKHVSGGVSLLGVKSFQQGRGSFEGTEQDGVWLDEEPPLDVYGECLIRTATTGGIVMITFTPLEGISNVVRSFLPSEYLVEGERHA